MGDDFDEWDDGDPDNTTREDELYDAACGPQSPRMRSRYAAHFEQDSPEIKVIDLYLTALAQVEENVRINVRNGAHRHPNIDMKELMGPGAFVKHPKGLRSMIAQKETIEVTVNYAIARVIGDRRIYVRIDPEDYEFEDEIGGASSFTHDQATAVLAALEQHGERNLEIVEI